MQDLPILGLCRFSLVHAGVLESFASTRGLSLEEAAARTYAPERMDLRFRLFESSCLPSFDALHRESRAAVGLILIGRGMPSPWKNRLRACIGDRTSVRICAIHEARSFGRSLVRIVRRESGDGRYFCYRVDDDDALSPAFVSDVLDAAPHVSPGAALTCVQGFMVGRYGEDVFRVKLRRYPFNAQGLGLYSGPPEFRTIFQLGHHRRIAKRVPEVREVEPPRWIRFVHGGNDSGQAPIDAPDLTLDQAAAALQPWFSHITARELAALPFHRSGPPDA